MLFVTSADRPFTETERGFLELIRDWGKKIVVVLNKRDLIDRPVEPAQIERFIAENTQRLLGIQPPIFAVSARQARRAQDLSHPVDRQQGLKPHLARFSATCSIPWTRPAASASSSSPRPRGR